MLSAPHDAFCQHLLLLDHQVDTFFQGSDADELMYLDIFLLSNAKRSIGGLILHCRVPPAVKVENIVGSGQVKTHTATLEREVDHRPPTAVFLQTPHHTLL